MNQIIQAVLLPLRPQWCEKMAEGKKKLEIRTSVPKLKPPFKVYIYCTKEHNIGERLWVLNKQTREQFNKPYSLAHMFGAKEVCGAYKGNGKVIGEFICDAVKIFPYVSVPTAGMILNMPEDGETPIQMEETYLITDEELTQTCLSYQELVEYGVLQPLFGWHISDLVFYDQPKELSEFWSADKCPYAGERCSYQGHCFRAGQETRCGSRVERAPQSWRYVAAL